MKPNFNEVINRKGTYCTQWDYIEDRFGEKELLAFLYIRYGFSYAPRDFTRHLKKAITTWDFWLYTLEPQDFKESIQQLVSTNDFPVLLIEDWIVYSPQLFIQFQS